MTERAAVYCRISEDPRQTEKGVSRQREDCVALVDSRGWSLVDVWTDNDVAVLRAGSLRPGYDAMMASVERGEVTRIVAYGLARLWRNRSERAAAIDVLSRHRVSIALVKGSDMDLTSAAGRMIVDMLGVADTMESELKAERVARAALQRADEGRASGHVSYGWRRVRARNANGEVIDWHDEIDPEQAEIVKEIVDRLLREESVNALVRDLNKRGVLPPRAALHVANGQAPGASKWLPSTIRKIAMRPANIGKVVRGRKIHGDAAWPAIVDADRHARVVAMLTDPSRVTTNGGARKHLLTFGIGECGKCGTVLRVLKRGGNELYVCNAPSGCVGRRREWVDDLVERVVVARLSLPDARDLLVREDHSDVMGARERAEGIRARLAEVADAFADGEIDRAQLTRITAKLRPKLDEAERESARVVRGVAPELVAQLAGPQAAARWTDFSVTQRRALLKVLGMRVRVMPARGGPGFKPESVKIDWNGATVG